MILRDLVDIHAHILPGIDDGPGTLEESVEMAKIAYGEGIRTIVCTPHALQGYDELIARAGDALDRLQEALKQKKVPISLQLGFEVLVSESLLQYPSLERLAFRLDGRKHMLLEFDFCRFPVCLEETLQRLTHQNIRPVLAHPERYPYLLGNIVFLENLKNWGVLLQINAGSITGEYGRTIQGFARKIFQSGLVDRIATDMHSSHKRGPYVRQAYRLLESWASAAPLYVYTQLP